MNGRVAKLIRKDSGFNPHDPKQRELFHHPAGRFQIISGSTRHLYQLLKKEYAMSKPKGKGKGKGC